MMKALITSAFVAAVAVAATAQITRTPDDDRESGIVDRSIETDRIEFDYQFGVAGSAGREHYVAEMPDLESGDTFKVRFRASQRLYVYLFTSNSDGTLSLLTPGAGAEDSHQDAMLVKSRSWVTLPDQNATLRLDEHRGTEHIYLLAAPRPIEEIESLSDAGGNPESVSESWLRRLRDRRGTGHADRMYKRDFVHASFPGDRLAIEEVTFSHR
jgi:hypothetical protein